MTYSLRADTDRHGCAQQHGLALVCLTTSSILQQLLASVPEYSLDGATMNHFTVHFTVSTCLHCDSHKHEKAFICRLANGSLRNLDMTVCIFLLNCTAIGHRHYDVIKPVCQSQSTAQVKGYTCS